MTGPLDVVQLMEDGDRFAARNKCAILEAWKAVGESAGGLSLFRVDGLLWEIGERIHQKRRWRTAAREDIAAMLSSRGADERLADALAAELTQALPAN